MALTFRDPFIPLKGYWKRTRGFKDHPKAGWPGVDYGLLIRSKLLAVSRGYVDALNKNNDGKGFGRYIRYNVADSKWRRTKWSVAYAHLREVKVRRGQRVHSGQLIGLSGNSGASTGPHLHFSLLENVGGRLIARNPENPRYVKWDIKNYTTPPYPPKPKPKPKPKPNYEVMWKQCVKANEKYEASIKKLENTIRSLQEDYTTARMSAVDTSNKLVACEKELKKANKPKKDLYQPIDWNKNWIGTLWKLAAKWLKRTWREGL
jgi:murein DD-endopeptidase MepM/ murein hydrolase activator NlpD